MSAMGNLVLDIQESLSAGQRMATVAADLAEEYNLPFETALRMVMDTIENFYEESA
jgi:hypothetical protein